MKFFELVKKNRSFRRFDERVVVDRSTLLHLVEHARFSAASANIQPLKYMLLHGAEGIDKVFPLIKWAGYLKDWHGPVEGERPTGYIVILGDTEISKGFGTDHGIAAQSIMLGAAAAGLGGCMIGSIDRKGLTLALSLSDRYEILLVLALGKRAESVVVEDVTDETGIKYWRSEDGVHHVPKRSFKDLIVEW